MLPAHGEPFRGLHARLDRLAHGHERGLQRLRRSLAEAPKRAIDVFGALFARPIDSTGDLLGMATGESLAHLNCLMARGEASDLFGRERGDALAAILGNLEQSVFGEPAYPTFETKAAHLLYFVIKNHPFLDGNKRTGAFLFVEFLARNGRLLRDGMPVINDVGLAALALLIAESDAKNKDVMIRLIENMLALPASGGG